MRRCIALSGLGLKVRFGAHTGEIETRGEDISGLGVVVASRIMDQANEGQILASDLVRQLMLGSFCRFEDRGFQELKGFPDAWRLYKVGFELRLSISTGPAGPRASGLVRTPPCLAETAENIPARENSEDSAGAVRYR